MPPAAQPMLPSFRHERSWKKQGFQVIAGIDEAGRGPLAGPVSVAAVVLPEGFRHKKLNDSKQLNEEQREVIYEELMVTSGLMWSAVFVHVEEIDRINILQATRAGMRRAALSLFHPPHMVLIDGTPVPDFPFANQSLVKGDALSLSIAAASVIAKVTRDRYMKQAALEHPHYGFDRHKGYGTREHLAALREHGVCPLHRRTFAPVAEICRPADAA